MELRPGYWLSEIGAIPEDWICTELHQISDRIMVGIASAATHAYRSKGIAMFRNQNIKPNRLDDSDVLFISPEYEQNFKNKRLKCSDLLTARTGYPGTTCLVPCEYEGAQSFTTLITRLKSSLVEPRFLCYFINSELGQNYFKQNQIGGGQKNVNVSSLRRLVIPLPSSRMEQEAISEVLCDADTLVESLEQLIAKKSQIKQGMVQELLTGDRRLPGFLTPWKTKRLEELADIRSGGTPSTSQTVFWDGDIPWCTPTDITALKTKKYISSTARQISNLGLKNSSAELIPVDSVLMTSRATIGECAINEVPCATNQGFKNFIPFANTDCEFLYYLLQTQKHTFASLSGGSTFLEIGKTQLQSFEVFVPLDKVEQSAIAAVLSDMDEELSNLESKLAKVRQLKQGMMQQLLTGRIRLLPKD